MIILIYFYCLQLLSQCCCFHGFAVFFFAFLLTESAENESREEKKIFLKSTPAVTAEPLLALRGEEAKLMNTSLRNFQRNTDIFQK